VALAALAFNLGSPHAGVPADKMFAAASKSQKVGPTPRLELLTAKVHNSKTADIVLQLSMECSIITDAVIAGSTVPGASESATTAGAVRAWIEIDGVIVPIISSSTPPQNPPLPGDDSDKVTFCNRVFNRTVGDAESPQDGYDKSKDYIATKDSNAFNWVRLNMGAGDHTISVFGEFTESFSAGSAASAYIGNRSLVGIPGKFANDAVISDVSTS
jgi:hypothetical protein